VEQPNPFVQLLAPVPLGHLQSGLQVLAAERYVAFGSRAWELFRKLDELRADRPVRIWIYASDNPNQPLPLSATWTGVYVGHVTSRGGAHPQGMRYRPESTRRYEGDNSGEWAVFLHVTELRELSAGEYLPIHAMTGLDKASSYSQAFAPEGPILIEPAGGGIRNRSRAGSQRMG